MTAIADQDSSEQVRPWEVPGRLLRRYVSNSGVQALGGALCLIGFAIVIFGWYKISKESIVALQIPYLISGGIGGALLVALGGVLLVSHDLRLDTKRLEEMEASIKELRDAFLAEVDTTASTGSGAKRVATATEFVQVMGGKRYHRADCAVAAGKDVTPVDHPEDSNLEPCRLCMA
jgi:hypothetical protein